MTSKETPGKLLDGLRAAHQAYRDSGGSFEALVTAILSSDFFISHPETNHGGGQLKRRYY